MKILKYLVFLILIVLIGSAIYFGTKDGTYEIRDSKTVEAPVELVFQKVNNLKSWESWSPWIAQDENHSFTYAEKSAGEGSSFSWDGKTGGSIVTTKVIPNKEIIQTLTVMSSLGERHSTITWEFEEMEGVTKINWTIKGVHTLTDKVSAAIFGGDFNANMHKENQHALNKIATELEDDMKFYAINVDGITQYGGGYYMYTTTVAKQHEVNERLEAMLQEVSNFIEKNHINAAGKPLAIYNEIDDANGTVIFSAGIPVKEQVITPEGSTIVSGYMERISAVKISLKGDYKHLPEAYIKGRAYIDKNSLEVDSNAKIFEVYETDPMVNRNPADWVTDIYIPIVTQKESEDPEF